MDKVKLLVKVDELLTLEQGWDSYGARVIDPANVEAAKSFIRLLLHPNVSEPHVIPTNKGGVVLEWHEQGTDLEMTFEGGTITKLYVECDSTVKDLANKAFRLAPREHVLS